MKNAESEPLSYTLLPPEPFVVVRNGEKLEPLYLRQALEQIVVFEEKRAALLRLKKIEVSLKFPPGSHHPRSKRRVREERISLERETRRKPKAATSYPLIDFILRSPLKDSNEPQTEILASLSPLSEKFARDGKRDPHPFYHFICDRLVTEAINLLNNKAKIEFLWEIFDYRLKLKQGVETRKISPSQAMDKMVEFSQEVLIPPESRPLVEEISKRYPLY